MDKWFAKVTDIETTISVKKMFRPYKHLSVGIYK